MRWPPRLAVVTAPLALEAFRVAAVHPELGFLEVDCLGAGVERALDALAEVFPVVGPGAHVINIAAVACLLPVQNGLGLVFVVHAVEPAVEVILIGSPRNAGHDVDAIAVVAPRLDALRQAGVDAVNEDYVGAQVGDGAPGRSRLEASAFQLLLRVSRKSNQTLRCKGRKGRQQNGPKQLCQAKHGGWTNEPVRAFTRHCRREPQMNTDEHGLCGPDSGLALRASGLPSSKRILALGRCRSQ